MVGLDVNSLLPSAEKLKNSQPRLPFAEILETFPSGYDTSHAARPLVPRSRSETTRSLLEGTHLSTKSKGAPMMATDAVHEGDMVSVAYHDMSGTMHAASVRVTSAKPMLKK